MNIYAYKLGSAGAKALSEAMKIKRIRHKNSKFKGRESKVVINWGASELPEEVAKCTIINNPESCARASNKLDFFKHMSLDSSETRIPEFTEDPEFVEEWLDEGHKVVARTILNGHSANGLVMLSEGDEIVPAKLYTKYVPKKEEYRVHVLRGELVHVQRKARRRDVADEDVNWQVRNYENGFTYQMNDFETPEDVVVQAMNAIEELGLDFGAADVLWNDKRGEAYVVEVNTAPGLEGTTLTNYVNAFKELL